MRLPAILRGRRRSLWARLVANGLAQAVTTVGMLLLIRLAFDRLVKHGAQTPNSLILWVGLGLAAAGCRAGLHALERIDAERLGQDYVHAVRLRLFDHLRVLSPRVLQRRSRGGVMLRFVGDLTALRQWVSLGLTRLMVAGFTTLSALAALAIVNWVLVLTVMMVLVPGTLLTLSLGRRMRQASIEARRRRSLLAANINEKIAAMAVVQVFGQSERERRRLARQSRRLREAMITRAKSIGFMRAVTQGSTMLAYGVALLVGAHEVAAGRATPGIVVAAMTIVGLLQSALRDLGRVHEYWHGAQVSRRKILEFLATPAFVTEVAHAPDLQPGPGCLAFEDVHLAGAVRNVTAVVQPGTVVALVGPNGAGKSTLLALAARLIDPDTGHILLDGQDLAIHSLASVRHAIGMVSPDLPLLRGTVAKNLRYRWPDAPAEAIAQVRSLCQLDEMLATLPEGEQTRVTEGGGNLSLGQRQRLALARALLGNPPVLLLDEAEVNLDTEATAVLDRILTAYRGTVLFVTHNPARLAVADVIWHLEGGTLVEGNAADAGGAPGSFSRDFGREQLAVH